MEKVIAALLICFVSFPVFSTKGRSNSTRKAIRQLYKAKKTTKQTRGLSKRTKALAKKGAAFAAVLCVVGSFKDLSLAPKSFYSSLASQEEFLAFHASQTRWDSLHRKTIREPNVLDALDVLPVHWMQFPDALEAPDNCAEISYEIVNSLVPSFDSSNCQVFEEVEEQEIFCSFDGEKFTWEEKV